MRCGKLSAVSPLLCHWADYLALACSPCLANMWLYFFCTTTCWFLGCSRNINRKSKSVVVYVRFWLGGTYPWVSRQGRSRWVVRSSVRCPRNLSIPAFFLQSQFIQVKDLTFIRPGYAKGPGMLTQTFGVAIPGGKALFPPDMALICPAGLLPAS